MSRYNTPTLSRARAARIPDTTNYAGGAAWVQTPELELASLVTTSMVNDQFYRSAEDGLERMRALVAQVDPVFAAKAAVYARNTDGLRSITHAVAGEIAHSVKGEQWTKDFYRAVVRRPDDVTEILAYYIDRYKKPIPNSLKKGLASALDKFDEYQLAKYRGEKHGISLVDAVNLVHPRPGSNSVALSKLVNGKLRSSGTFESELSAAGSDADAKAEAWESLLVEGKIGYMALLKNLRNIAEQAPKLVPRACELLTDPKRVAGSLVLPFRFLTAMRQLEAYPRIGAALSDAMDLSLVNIPDIGDSVYISVDGSGSMGRPVAGNPDMTCKAVGAVFAAALYKRNFADVSVFGSTCGPVTGLNPKDSTLTIAERIHQTHYGHSTNFPSVFEYAPRKAYDTVVIFSDMQAWVKDHWGYSDPRHAFETFKVRTKSNPKVFTFDLTGYGTAQFPYKDVCQLSGFSDKSIALMAQLREDPQALVTAIKAVTF